MKFLFWTLKVLLGWTVWVMFRPKKRYVDKKATKTKGGAVIISNHTSVLDGMLLGLTFPLTNIWSLSGNACFKKNPLTAFILRMFMCIRVDKDKSHNLAFMSQAVDKLNKGDSVLIFPQSRLPYAGEKTTPPFLPTFILLAKTAGKPIIPVWHSEQYGIHRTKISVGAPIYVDENDCATYEELNALTRTIQDKLFALADLHNAQKD